MTFIGIVGILMAVVYVSIAFEVDRRRRNYLSPGNKYLYKGRRINIKKRCSKLLRVLLFNT